MITREEEKSTTSNSSMVLEINNVSSGKNIPIFLVSPWSVRALSRPVWAQGWSWRALPGLSTSPMGDGKSPRVRLNQEMLRMFIDGQMCRPGCPGQGLSGPPCSQAAWECDFQ